MYAPPPFKPSPLPLHWNHHYPCTHTHARTHTYLAPRTAGGGGPSPATPGRPCLVRSIPGRPFPVLHGPKGGASAILRGGWAGGRPHLRSTPTPPPPSRPVTAPPRGLGGREGSADPSAGDSGGTPERGGDEARRPVRGRRSESVTQLAAGEAQARLSHGAPGGGEESAACVPLPRGPATAGGPAWPLRRGKKGKLRGLALPEAPAASERLGLAAAKAPHRWGLREEARGEEESESSSPSSSTPSAAKPSHPTPACPGSQAACLSSRRRRQPCRHYTRTRDVEHRAREASPAPAPSSLPRVRAAPRCLGLARVHARPHFLPGECGLEGMEWGEREKGRRRRKRRERACSLRSAAEAARA